MEAQNNNQPTLDNHNNLYKIPDKEDQKNVPGCRYCCTLANLRIEKKIGRGQFSEVYKATYLLEGQLVALKKVQVLTDPDVDREGALMTHDSKESGVLFPEFESHLYRKRRLPHITFGFTWPQSAI